MKIPTLAKLFSALVAAACCTSAVRAQVVAYDDAGNYLLNNNWTSGANGGTGFTPWMIVTNGPNFLGNYLLTGNNPPFVIASTTNVLGTNYTGVWGLYANGTNAINESAAFRGFNSPLGTNTFKVQWGSRGAGVTAVDGQGQVHGWCGFTLRNGNATNTAADFQSGTLFYLYFLDGSAPSTLYIWDGNGVQSVPGTSFSDLGRNNITNAIQAELTPSLDGANYHLEIKDCVLGKTLYTIEGPLIGNSSIDSAALFAHETTGDQVFNRMQIVVPHLAPTISSLQPANGAVYLDANTTTLSFQLDSFNSTIPSNNVSVYLNGVQVPNLVFGTGDATAHLTVNASPTLTPDKFYTYTIVASDAVGNTVSNTYAFNTFLSTDIYIDAYDYNFGAGQFINASTPANSYVNQLGTNGIDYSETDPSGTNNLYRPGDLPQVISLATDSTGDPIDHANLRANSFTAYNIAFTDPNEWQNYTRVYPSTNYSIYARAASGTGGQFEVERLTNAVATISNQPLAALGRVSVPNTGGSRVYSGQLMPVLDAFGNPVVMPLSGTNTLRVTALSNRGYNLKYLVFVAVTNSEMLRPYLSVASPLPNATGVGLATPISLTLANRQTLVNATTVKLFTNGVQVVSGLTYNTNLSGATVTYTPTVNRGPNTTNVVMVTFVDNTGENLTNTWTFVTGTIGGTLGNGLWSGGGIDLNWSTAANWTGGTPGPGFNASFATPGSTTTLTTNNIVSTNVTIQGLFYNTNNNGYHTTYIADGVRLTVTNGNTGVTAIMQVGGATGSDNVFNKGVTNTISGAGGTLYVSGNSQSVGGNQLNIQIRQSANAATPELVVLDMSKLGTFFATIGKFYIAQGGGPANNFGQTNVSGRVDLAMTNTITCIRANNAGTFEVGDSSGGIYTLAGSTLNFGITNALYADTIRLGKQKATNNLIRFNPIFTNSTTPSAFIRGTNGLNSRVGLLTIADADTEINALPVFSQANLDFTGGRVDMMVNSLIIGRSGNSASDTGFAQGVLTMTAGTLDVTSLQIGQQRGANSSTASGVLNVNGTSTLLSTNILLAQGSGGAGLATGTLNIGGTVKGNIFAGGGSSIVNVTGGNLTVTKNAGMTTAGITTITFSGGSLHLNLDGTATTAIVIATNVIASSAQIVIDSVTNVSGPLTIHLVGYAGSDPFAGFSLGSLPSGYSGTLADNISVIDLNINVSAVTVAPTIRTISFDGGQVIIGGTNNVGTASTYHVLTSTNVALPLTNWTSLGAGSFDGSGNFSSTNAVGPEPQRFYILQVP